MSEWQSNAGAVLGTKNRSVGVDFVPYCSFDSLLFTIDYQLP